MPWAGMLLSPYHCCFCAGFILLLVFVWHLLQGVPILLQLPGTLNCLKHSNDEWCCLERRSQSEQNRGSPHFFPSWCVGKAILQTVLFNPSVSSASSQWHTGLVRVPGLSSWAQSCPRLGFLVGNEVPWIPKNFKHFQAPLKTTVFHNFVISKFLSAIFQLMLTSSWLASAITFTHKN